MPITIAIADDHPMMRQGMIEFFGKLPEFQLIFQAPNGKVLLDELNTRKTLPDICVLDLQMPVMNGFETLEVLRKEYPGIKVLIYSMHLESYNLQRIYKFGANGGFSKDEGILALGNALTKVYHEGLYIPDNIDDSISEAIKNHRTLIPNLTPREIEFVKLCCEELSYKEIAERMDVNVKTVDRYKENIGNKLNIKTKTGIILFAVKTGIAGWN